MGLAAQNQTLSLEAMLAFQLEMGADECVLDAPLDYFEVKKEHENTPKQAIVEPTSAPTTPKQPSDISSKISNIMGVPAAKNATSTSKPIKANVAEHIAAARALADAANTLEELRAAIIGFKGCDLYKTAKNIVFSDGNPSADTMFIGEAPGAEEDVQGVPFCGKSGQLLDEMLSYIDLHRHDIPDTDTKANFYIANTIFWRPPGNRKPSTEELAICAPFVEKHIALINPKRIICVGGTSAQSLLQQSVGITRLRGKEYTYKNEYIESEIPAFVFLHPAYLLRQPIQKRNAWQDMLALKKHL